MSMTARFLDFLAEQQESLLVFFASSSFCTVAQQKCLHSLWMDGPVVVLLVAALLQLQVRTPHRRKRPGYMERFRNSGILS